MSFWKKIVGDKAKSPSEMSGPEVEAALAKLRAERESAQQTVAGSLERRQEALVDASDLELTKIDRDREAAELLLDRADALEPLLIARVAELQSEQRNELFEALLGSFRQKEAALDAALAAVVESLSDYREGARQIDAAGFAAQAASLIVRAPLHGDGVMASAATLESWRRQRETVKDRKAAFEARRNIVPLPAAKGPYRAQKFVPPMSGRLAPPIERKPPPAHDPGWRKLEPRKLTGPVGPGRVRVECQLDGVDFGGRQNVTGDQHDVVVEIWRDHLSRGVAFKLVAIPEQIDEAAQ
jgi:hypothetical protein